MEWRVEQGETEIVIYGPGGLEIMLREFDPIRVQRLLLSAALAGGLIQRSWAYPLYEGVTLELVSVLHPKGDESHRLRLGDRVRWMDIPNKFAEALHSLGKEAATS